MTTLAALISKFSNEYVKNEIIIRKSDTFVGLTSSLWPGSRLT